MATLLMPFSSRSTSQNSRITASGLGLVGFVPATLSTASKNVRFVSAGGGPTKHHLQRHYTPWLRGNTFVGGSACGSGRASDSPLKASLIGRMSTKADIDVIPPSPPVPRREEDRVIWAGKATPSTAAACDKGDNSGTADVPRQAATSKERLLDPPVAIPDVYGWMRHDDRSNVPEEIRRHLELENSYTAALTSHLEGLRQSLYESFLKSIQETDYTMPRPWGEWWYYTRTFQGKSYKVHCRAPKQVSSNNQEVAPWLQWDGKAESPVIPGEQVLVDENALAAGHDYCAMGNVRASPSHKYLAYALDTVGFETCKMFVLDLTKKKSTSSPSSAAETEHDAMIVDHNPDLETDGTVCWGSDDSTIFYLKHDDAHRPFQLYRRKLRLGQDEEPLDVAREDELLMEELDEMFWMGVSKTLDDRFLLVELSSKETSEVHFLDLHSPDARLQCVAKRRPKVLYDVDHRKGFWWITSNVGGLPNMALFTCPAKANCQDEWSLVLDASTNAPLFDGNQLDKILESVSCFEKHVVFTGRMHGLPQVWIGGWTEEDQAGDGGASRSVDRFERLLFEEDAYDVGLHAHYEFKTSSVVVAYESLVTPAQVMEINMDVTSIRSVLKERSVPGYDKTLYACDRLTVTSRDGTTPIPVSMVYRKETMEKHKETGSPVHVHLYGYGSYGSCIEADFSSTRLALLDRGMVFVMAHVRGGGEMGRHWYEEPNGAKYLCKKNTFNDFVDVGRWLVEGRRLTEPEKLSCEGRSAGGLLIGASINQAPELFRVALLIVPFVDCVPTMCDARIPLTAIEWEEWGNPNEEKFHKYMMEYSPTSNVKSGTQYPACLLTGGLQDPRVPYWEPAKLAALLRHAQSSGNDSTKSGWPVRPICVKMDMTSGHFSASDRYKFLKELAFQYAFLLGEMGLAEK